MAVTLSASSYDVLASLGRERLMPVDRKTYIRQLGMAALVSHVQLWGGMSMVLAVVVLVDQSTARGYGWCWPVLGISALLQIWILVALAWLASFRSLLIATPGLVFVVVMTLVLIFASLQPTMSFELPLAGLASLGLLLAYVAYRRWLKADFD